MNFCVFSIIKAMNKPREGWEFIGHLHIIMLLYSMHVYIYMCLGQAFCGGTPSCGIVHSSSNAKWIFLLLYCLSLLPGKFYFLRNGMTFPTLGPQIPWPSVTASQVYGMYKLAGALIYKLCFSPLLLVHVNNT